MKIPSIVSAEPELVAGQSPRNCFERHHPEAPRGGRFSFLGRDSSRADALCKMRFG